MKIRIKGNSIRFRLTKTDLVDLTEKGIVKEETVFNFEAVFGYAIIVDASSEEITVQYKDHCFTVYLPEKDAAILTASDETSVKNSQYNGKNEGLLILIEKDEPCLHSTSENYSKSEESMKTTR